MLDYYKPVKKASLFYWSYKMCVSNKNCKYSKTEDKGLSFLCFIHYFQLISVTFLRKTALLCSLIIVC